MPPSPLASAVLITWQRNASYAVRLVQDVAPEQFVAQPVPGRVINHPAWVLSHLNLYAGIAAAMCRGEGFEDPAEHRYGQKSKPLADLAAYPTKDEMITEWTRHHDAAAASLRGAWAALTAAANPLERWRAINPTVGDMLVTLMVKHESFHLGQLSAWRRGIGLASVPM